MLSFYALIVMYDRIRFDFVRVGVSVSHVWIVRPLHFHLSLTDIESAIAGVVDGEVRGKLKAVVKIIGTPPVWEKLGSRPVADRYVFTESRVAFVQLVDGDASTPQSSPSKSVRPGDSLPFEAFSSLHLGSESAFPISALSCSTMTTGESAIWEMANFSLQRVRPELDLENAIRCDTFGAAFPFVGRDAEMVVVNKSILETFNAYANFSSEAARDVPILAFGGVSGSGKTRLAFEAASYFNVKQESTSELIAIASRLNCESFTVKHPLPLVMHALAGLVCNYANSSPSAAMSVARAKLSGVEANDIASVFADRVLERGFVGKRVMLILNLDEAQKASEDILKGLLAEISTINTLTACKGLTIFPVLTGLDLSKFSTLKTESGRNIIITSLGPVFDLWRVFAGVLNMTVDSPFSPAMMALLLALDGVPRLLWVLAIELMNVSSQQKHPCTPTKSDTISTDTPSFFARQVRPSHLVDVMSQLQDAEVSSLYRSIVATMSSSSGAFTSLESLCGWGGRTHLLAYALTGVSVALETQIHDLSVSHVISKGYALPLRKSGVGDLELYIPLVYLHKPQFEDVNYANLGYTLRTLVSPGKKLEPDVAEAIDVGNVAARFQAFTFLKPGPTVLVASLLGCPVPLQFRSAAIVLPGLQSFAPVTNVTSVWKHINTTQSPTLSFVIGPGKETFADSACILPLDVRDNDQPFATIKMDRGTTSPRRGHFTEYQPRFPRWMALLIQSKRFLATNLTSKVVLEEWDKVEKTFQVMPFLLLLVTDARVANCERIIPDRLSEWVMIIDELSLPSFLGRMLSRRRFAAVEVSRQFLKKKRRRRGFVRKKQMVIRLRTPGRTTLPNTCR
jgi:hypothetical protein